MSHAIGLLTSASASAYPAFNLNLLEACKLAQSQACITCDDMDRHTVITRLTPAVCRRRGCDSADPVSQTFQTVWLGT
jgi:hypothetical protein